MQSGGLDPSGAATQRRTSHGCVRARTSNLKSEQHYTHRHNYVKEEVGNATPESRHRRIAPNHHVPARVSLHNANWGQIYVYTDLLPDSKAHNAAVFGNQQHTPTHTVQDSRRLNDIESSWHCQCKGARARPCAAPTPIMTLGRRMSRFAATVWGKNGWPKLTFCHFHPQFGRSRPISPKSPRASSKSTSVQSRSGPASRNDLGSVRGRFRADPMSIWCRSGSGPGSHWRRSGVEAASIRNLFGPFGRRSGVDAESIRRLPERNRAGSVRSRFGAGLDRCWADSGSTPRSIRVDLGSMRARSEADTSTQPGTSAAFPGSVRRICAHRGVPWGSA